MAIAPSLEYCFECKKATYHHKSSVNYTLGNISGCQGCEERERQKELAKYYEELEQHRKEWDKLSLEQKVERIYVERMRPNLPSPKAIPHECNPVY